jgi:hypothetical protein
MATPCYTPMAERMADCPRPKSFFPNDLAGMRNLSLVQALPHQQNCQRPCMGNSRPGLILERASMPVAPFFPGGHTENLLTVPARHTDYASHSNFHF